MCMYRADVESPLVLCSASKLTSILSCWLKCVEDYTAQLSSSPGDNTRDHTPSLLTPPPPLSPLSSPVATALTYLISLCAELGIYSTAASESHDPGNLEDFIGRYCEVLDWSRVRCLLAKQEWAEREKGWWALIRAGGKCVG